MLFFLTRRDYRNPPTPFLDAENSESPEIVLYLGAEFLEVTYNTDNLSDLNIS
jgi:hypothetical protein